jgi:hypothetical protein
MRVRWLAVAAVGVAGCFGPRGSLPKVPPPVAVASAPAPVPPVVVPAAAVSPAPPAVAPEPEPEIDPLTLAAECLTRADDPAACRHLEAHVRAHPDQVMFRAQLAELHLKLDHADAARRHFERFVADAQDATGPARGHLVHAHTRLMEIGQRTDDRFAELFHRGVGLLLLLDEQADDEDGFVEEVLVKAVAALTEAKERRPADARVNLYLADAHDRAGNRRAADVARAAARNADAPGALTPAERRRLAAR